MSTAETPVGGQGWSQALDANLTAAGASSGHAPKPGAPLAPPGDRSPRTDELLARAAGRGDARAFELLYERHHRPLLSFARHMVGRPHDAEDVVQHTFAAADRAFRSGKAPKAVKAWLYAVARNRCVSILRARREDTRLDGEMERSTERLDAEVERRQELRDLLADLRRLPDDQRAALLLTELEDLSHAEVARVIGVRPGKVKALVFQARETLLALTHARGIPCESIREELAVASGAALRRRHLRNHLAQCAGCDDYAAQVRAQRTALAVVLPVVPTSALRESVLAGLASASGGASTAGAGFALVAAKSTAAKLLTIAAVGGVAGGAGTIAVTARDQPDRARPGATRTTGPQIQERVAPAVPARVRASEPRSPSQAPTPTPRRHPATPTARAQRPARAGRPTAPPAELPAAAPRLRAQPRSRATVPSAHARKSPDGGPRSPAAGHARGRAQRGERPAAPGLDKPARRQPREARTQPEPAKPPPAARASHPARDDHAGRSDIGQEASQPWSSASR